MCDPTIALCTLAALSVPAADPTTTETVIAEPPAPQVSAPLYQAEHKPIIVDAIASPEVQAMPETHREDANPAEANHPPVDDSVAQSYEIPVQMPPASSSTVKQTNSPQNSPPNSPTANARFDDTEDLEIWRQQLKRKYGIPDYPTPVTDRYGITGDEANSERWAATMHTRYDLAKYPTPITDRYGANSDDPNAELWLEAMIDRYKLRQHRTVR